MTSRPDKPATPVDRRKILAGGGLVAATAAVASALRPEAAEAFRATPEEKAARYQGDSPHVQRFYALNRR
jgi:hypothetical protein